MVKTNLNEEVLLSKDNPQIGENSEPSPYILIERIPCTFIQTYELVDLAEEKIVDDKMLSY